MIIDYEIKRQNKENILYIYYDFSLEFAKLSAKSKKRKLKKDIEKYLKKNKISFNGTKVAIIVGGALLGTVVLNQPKKEINDITPAPVVAILQDDKIELPDLKEEPVIEEETKQEDEIKVVSEIKEEVNKASTNSNSNKNVYNQNNSKSNNTTNNTTNNKVIPNVVEHPAPKQPEPSKPVETVPENKIYVNVNRKNGSVITLELEEYILGVVAAEMPASFNIEALKSQAILARTYALKAIKNNIPLTDTSSTQNYQDNSELEAKWGSGYNTYYNKIKNAVESTKGMYLTYQGEIIEAVYHSTSNGQTENAKNVWSNAFPYLISVSSPYDSNNKSFIAEKNLTYEEISTKLGIIVNSSSEFNILSYTEGNRIGIISIDGNSMRGVDFRNILGLRSADFQIEKSETGLKITTKGYGHGVGMSQYGANGFAQNGMNYQNILAHYYPGTILVSM